MVFYISFLLQLKIAPKQSILLFFVLRKSNLLDMYSKLQFITKSLFVYYKNVISL
ncbi:hypothetical protein C8C85_1284 [Flavobacterium sp. 103]|nr:hypothetical protein C8C85_1284 [Flavobacterium sp. 103]